MGISYGLSNRIEEDKMKKKALIILLACVLIITSLPAIALANEENFDNVFTDVSVNDWYYKGVKNTYLSGLMLGVGNKRFSPNSDLTLAQAVTIATRFHAMIFNKKIQTNGGTWYLPYWNYAINNGLLSKSMLTIELPDTVKATRAETSFLLYEVIKNSPISRKVINNSSIPDLQNIQSEYQEAVKQLYSYGIFAGMTDGLFHGDQNITRAQIAVIISRILNENERIPYDEKYNNSMAGQEGNYYMLYGHCAFDKTYSYYVIASSDSSNGYIVNVADIVRRNNITGEKAVVYLGNGIISNLKIENNKLYFIETTSTNHGGISRYAYSYLVSLDLNKLEATSLFRTERYHTIKDFALYGEHVYLEYWNPDTQQTILVGINKNTGDLAFLKLLYNDSLGLSYYGMSIFNDTLYYSKENVSNQTVFAYDLIAMTTKEIATVDRFVFSQGVIYFLKNNCIYSYNAATGDNFKDDCILEYQGNKNEYIYNISIKNRDILFSRYLNGEHDNTIYKVVDNNKALAVESCSIFPATFIFDGAGKYYYYSMLNTGLGNYRTQNDGQTTTMSAYLQCDDYSYAVHSVTD